MSALLTYFVIGVVAFACITGVTALGIKYPQVFFGGLCVALTVILGRAVSALWKELIP